MESVMKEAKKIQERVQKEEAKKEAERKKEMAEIIKLDETVCKPILGFLRFFKNSKSRSDRNEEIIAKLEEEYKNSNCGSLPY